jgi:hypothetical protein
MYCELEEVTKGAGAATTGAAATKGAGAANNGAGATTALGLAATKAREARKNV